MTNEIAKILAGSLEPLYEAELVTVLCGLTTTVRQEKSGAQTSVRFPVPYDFDSSNMQINQSDLVPDSRKRAIIYFEGSDTDIPSFESNKSKASTNLRLVCWYNSNMLQPMENHSVHSLLTSAILKLLSKAKTKPESVVQGLKIEVTRIYDSASTLFSKYTYREEYGQYLQKPYFALGIDITATYQINHGCTSELLPVNVTDCC